MLALAGSAGMPVIVTTLFDSGVGVAMTTQLAALLGDAALPCGLATLELLEASLVIGGPSIDRARLTLPTRPGLGVRLDSEALARFANGPIAEVRG